MMTMKTMLVAVALAVLTALPTSAGSHSATEPRKDLEALIVADPTIATELEAAIAKAALPGIASLEDFYHHVDDTFR